MPANRNSPRRIDRFTILALLLPLWVSAALASDRARPLILEVLSTREGLPQGTVMSALQDSQGFVWLGTEDGLVRFDGHEVYRYAYSANDAGSLPGNFINAIVEDRNTNLWVAVKSGGVARWDRATDRFTAYRHDSGNAGSLCSDAVRSLLIGEDGRVWIGTTDCGIEILDPASGAIEHLRHEDGRQESLINDQVQVLTRDRSGRLWIGTHGGLDLWQPERRAFIHIGAGSADSRLLAGKPISQIVQDRAGGIWIATFDAGLVKLDVQGRVQEVYQHNPASQESLSSNDVRAFLDDGAGHFWVGTSEGLDLLSTSGQGFEHYGHELGDPNSLNDSFIMSLYQDHSGIVWIGTRSGGVSRWNPHSWELGASRPAWLDGKLVTSFADAADHQVWIGSLGGGLGRVDLESGQRTDIDDIVHHADALGDRRVMSLLQDSHGVLWVGMMTAGLKKVVGASVTTIPVRAGSSAGISAPGIMSLFESRSGLIWIGTHGGGVNVLDPRTGAIRQLPFAPAQSNAVSAPSVTAFAEDHDGNIWIGTDGGGLNLARPDGAVIRVFHHDANDPMSLAAETVYSLVADADGRIWAATDGGGLSQVIGSAASPSSIHFRNYSQHQGLSSDTIYGLLADSQGHLWLSGNAGLMRFDPQTGAVKTFHREHGLQGEEFNFGAYFRTRDGRLCFGGPGGYNVFNPARLSEPKTPPQLALTRLEILGAPALGTTSNWLLHELVLDYRANIVSFDFAALDFTSPNRNRLAYRMKGLTDEWIDLGTQRRVTLTNLDPGDHVLEVRAANADSIWTEKPLRLTLHKAAAPWRSQAAYVGYGLLGLVMVLLGVLFQRRKLNRALAGQQRLESEVALRTQELRHSNQQLVEANETKSSFLARMSHELRTPMNGVVGMTELLVRTPLSGSQSRQVQTIRSSAQTLLKILNDLLDLSKAQAGKVQLESLPVDLTELLEESAALFSGAAEAKGLTLTVSPACFEGTLLGDGLRVRQVLMNLIGNAVKFTERGSVAVACDVSMSDEQSALVHFTITDSGIGMSEAALEKIFEPFSQADETTTRRFGGTGLGLAICHELIKAMSGTISVHSRPQVGSTFRVVLPLKRVAAPATPAAVPLQGVDLGIISRSPAMQESLRRYLLSLGASAELLEAGQSRDTSAVVIIDLDTCPESFQQSQGADKRHERVVAVGSSASIERLSVEKMLAPEQIVRQPVFRNVLLQALEAALGVSRAQTMLLQALVAPAAHVLLVEDEPVNAAVAEGYLAELGCSCVWVADGQAAVARFAAEHFDLIFMDLNMPGLDGYQTAALIRQSRQQGPHIPIVALTANQASTTREACLQAGIDDFLSKPYTLTQCADVLRRWGHLEKGQAPPIRPAADRGRSLAVVDASVVGSLRQMQRGRSANLYSRLVTLFQTSSTEATTLIATLLDSDDLGGARAVCHKLKSAAANVGALNFAKHIGELEAACNTGDRSRARVLQELAAAALPSLLAELDLLTLEESA